MQDLNQLLKILSANNTEFVIVGGFAAVLHGANHVTKDLDLWPITHPREYFKVTPDAQKY